MSNKLFVIFISQISVLRFIIEMYFSTIHVFISETYKRYATRFFVKISKRAKCF